jgi:signal transduction histidine kinase
MVAAFTQRRGKPFSLWRQVAAAGVYLVVVGVLVVEGQSEPLTREGPTPGALAYAILGLASVALLFRYRAPLLVAGIALLGLVIWRDVIDYQSRAINIPYLVALYAVALTGTARRTVLVGVGISLFAVARAVVLGETWIVAATAIGWTISALLFGEIVRARAELASEAEARARLAEADRELEAARRVTEERLRIARELHDVIAHTVSVMSVQTGVAADALDNPPEEVRNALATVRSAARDANRELRVLVGLLRSPEGSDLAPTPGLADVDRLVRDTEDTGVLAELTERGQRRQLSAVIELTAYRVVQEALTNVARHSAAGQARVGLDFGDTALVVEVIDEGPGVSSNNNGIGLGLRGMAERVEVLGGALDYGPREPNGFGVRARLPLEAGS